MQEISTPRVKICCISSAEEAWTAIELGASAVGFVGAMPSGPGVISDELIEDIVKTVPPPVATFLLTSETNAKDIIAHHRRVNTNTLQLVDKVTEDTYKKLRDALPIVKLVQVIHVMDEKSVDEAIKASAYVDMILLDSGNPYLETKELGGTGRTHNWELSRLIRESIDIPLFLAGGLNLQNVGLAIETVQPFGVDLCSSVRTDGKLDRYKLEVFLRMVNNY